MPRTTCKRPGYTALLMMRGRGLIGPGIQQGKKNVASPSKRNGVKPVGNFILYKVNNP